MGSASNLAYDAAGQPVHQYARVPCGPGGVLCWPTSARLDLSAPRVDRALLV